MSGVDYLIKQITKLKSLFKTGANKQEFLNQIRLITSLVKKPDIYDLIDELINYVEKRKDCTYDDFITKVNAIENFYHSKTEHYVPINDTFLESYTNQKQSGGTSLLCRDLDILTGGLQQGTVCTIVGGSGCMKTTYAVNICYNAMKKGKNICYLSLEETPIKLYSKLLSRASVDYGKKLPTLEVTTNTLPEVDEKVLLNEIYPYLEELKGNFYIIGENDLCNYDQSEFEFKINEVDKLLKEKSKTKQNDENHGIDILVVDHIQLLKYAKPNKDEYQVVNEYVSFFRRLSHSFLHQDREILVILLSQANREGMDYARKHNGKYLMQHVAEASEVERSSSYIVSVYTDGMHQVTKLLQVGAIKLRGSQLPLDTIGIYAEGEFYHVGDEDNLDKKEYTEDDIFNTNSKNNEETISSFTIEEIMGELK